MHAVLAQFLGAVLRQHSATVQANPQLLATCSHVLGDLAFWFSAAAAAGATDAPLAEAVSLCLGAAVTPGAGAGGAPRVCGEACTALRHLVAANIPAPLMMSPDLVQVCPCSCLHKTLATCSARAVSACACCTAA